jgi:hypothetical protein
VGLLSGLEGRLTMPGAAALRLEAGAALVAALDALAVGSRGMKRPPQRATRTSRSGSLRARRG